MAQEMQIHEKRCPFFRRPPRRIGSARWLKRPRRRCTGCVAGPRRTGLSWCSDARFEQQVSHFARFIRPIKKIINAVFSVEWRETTAKTRRIAQYVNALIANNQDDPQQYIFANIALACATLRLIRCAVSQSAVQTTALRIRWIKTHAADGRMEEPKMCEDSFSMRNRVGERCGISVQWTSSRP